MATTIATGLLLLHRQSALLAWVVYLERTFKDSEHVVTQCDMNETEGLQRYGISTADYGMVPALNENSLNYTKVIMSDLGCLLLNHFRIACKEIEPVSESAIA